MLVTERMPLLDLCARKDIGDCAVRKAYVCTVPDAHVSNGSFSLSGPDTVRYSAATQRID